MKSWKIALNDKLPEDVQKKLKKLLRPVHSVSHRGPEKCLFCGELTTWTSNNQPVCPKCSVQHGLRSELWLLDPCEICGKQGEWATDGGNPPQHFLCYQHRDDWFHWGRPRVSHFDYKKQPEEWQKAWDEDWAEFVAFMKERLGK